MEAQAELNRHVAAERRFVTAIYRITVETSVAGASVATPCTFDVPNDKFEVLNVLVAASRFLLLYKRVRTAYCTICCADVYAKVRQILKMELGGVLMNVDNQQMKQTWQ
jgi:hypothetical protein